jgi:hypothetical protein
MQKETVLSNTFLALLQISQIIENKDHNKKNQSLGKVLEFFEKSSHLFQKAPILLKMHLNSIAILEKASIFLKKSSKRIEIFIKASHF